MKLNQDIYYYNGSLHESEFISCVEFHKLFLKKEKYATAQCKLIISSLIESFHNVVKHSFFKSNASKTIFRTTILKGVFIINTINTVNEQQKLNLQETIDKLSKLSLIELKTLYLQRLEIPQLKNNIGANTGLILLFLNSNKKINFVFNQLDLDTFDFDLTITIITPHEKN